MKIRFLTCVRTLAHDSYYSPLVLSPKIRVVEAVTGRERHFHGVGLLDLVDLSVSVFGDYRFPVFALSILQ